MPGLLIQAASPFVRLRVRVAGRIAQKDQPSACPLEGFQPFQRRGAQSLTARNHHRVVGHLPHPQGRAALRALRGQQGFAEEIEIHAAVHQPVGQALEPLVHLAANAVGLLRRAPVEPVALHRMDHAYPHHRLSPGQRRIQPGEIIFYIGVILPPGGLIVDGRRIIPLGLALHGDPRQMLHPDGHAQRRLPVTVELVPPEIKIPAGNAVKLAGHTGAAILMHRALGLLGSGELPAAAEHVDARQLKAAIGAHGLAQRRRLAFQGGFLHHVARQHQAVLLTPAAAGIGEGLCEALGNMVVIMIPDQRNLSLRQLPEQLRQMLQQLLSVGRPEGFRQIVRPRQEHVLFLPGEGQRTLMGELGLVRENGGNNAAEVLADGFQIAFVGDLHEFLHRGGIQRIGVGLVVVPRIGKVGFLIGVPFPSRRFFCCGDSLGPGQAPVFIQLHIVAGQQRTILRAGGTGRRIQSRLGLAFAVGLRGQQQVPGAVLGVFGQKAARRAGGPAVLVVQPGQHFFVPAFFHAGLDQRHMLVAQIGRSHAGAHMHMSAAQAHFLQYFQLPKQLFLLQSAVPCPKGRAAIFAARMAELFLRQFLFSAFGIQHTEPPPFFRTYLFPAFLGRMRGFSPTGYTAFFHPSMGFVHSSAHHGIIWTKF